jgi:hypothetical protein
MIKELVRAMRTVGWYVLSACFIIPFICMLSRDVKGHGPGTICTAILAGLWTSIVFDYAWSTPNVPFGILG